MIQQRIVKTKPHLITQPQDKISEIEITLFTSSIYFLKSEFVESFFNLLAETFKRLPEAAMRMNS